MVAFVLLLFLATGVLSAGNTTSCAAKLDGVLPSQTPPNFHFSGNIRRYYIAAEEIDWNYAPSGWDNWLGIPLEYSPRAQSQSYTSPSLTWKKAVYRGYTDASFSQKSPQPAWQGVQGPTIRSEVGDMIEILFLNRLSKNYASIHSMGLSYNKDNEGSLYPNVTAEDPHPRVAAAAAVAPGDCVVYKWVVPDNAVMNNDPRQPATMHTYHSYVSFFEDMNAGLMGPQFTYQRGRMEETMRKYREFPVLFHEFDESKSNMASVNAKTLKNASSNTNLPAIFAKLRKYGNESIWRPQLTNHYGAEGFDDAPSFSGVNGYIYSNTPTFEMCVNDQVIWYIYGMFIQQIGSYHTHVIRHMLTIFALLQPKEPNRTSSICTATQSSTMTTTVPPSVRPKTTPVTESSP